MVMHHLALCFSSAGVGQKNPQTWHEDHHGQMRPHFKGVRGLLPPQMLKNI
jgi:hypothetical protein